MSQIGRPIEKVTVIPRESPVPSKPEPVQVPERVEKEKVPA